MHVNALANKKMKNILKKIKKLFTFYFFACSLCTSTVVEKATRQFLSQCSAKKGNHRLSRWFSVHKKVANPEGLATFLI